MKKKSIFAIVGIIFIAVIAYFGYQTASGSKTTQTVSKSSSNEKVLRVATTGVSFPGSYKDSNGDLTGFDVEIARAVGKKIGYKVEFITTSFDGLFGLLQSGQVDGYSNSKTILSAIIKQKNLDLKILDGELGQENIAIAFNKGKNKDLREKADKSVEELIKDGTVSKLSKKYFSDIDATYKK